MTKPFSEDMLFSLFMSFSLSLFVNMEMCALVFFPSLSKASSFLYKKRALSRTEQQEQRKQKTPLLFRSSSFTAVMMPFRKGVSTCACKSKQKDVFECEAFFQNFSFFLLPFFLVLIGRFFLEDCGLLLCAMNLSTCCYVLNGWFRSAFLRRYKVTKSCVLLSLSLSLSLSHSHSFYSVGLLLAPTLFLVFFAFYVSPLRDVLFYRLLFVS